ncbi:hypothetical protein X798_07208 [Onchocerca flexuosa]|uniref:DB module n=1 Tax=Onchocerca flexuosa TaxID=387005 RepID=A0A238BMS7_9BILA|nr:hypothetical protein X798_07208 [Onchocerca flexuosa]
MMITTIQPLSIRTFPLSLLLLLTFAITTSHQYYDPTMRDYVETCDEMAQLAGDNFCRVFDICCRDRAQNKLNGDRCQLTDPTNGCQLTPEKAQREMRNRNSNVSHIRSIDKDISAKFAVTSHTCHITTSDQYYDPTMSRDYVETCDEMAQLAGYNFRRVKERSRKDS